MDFAGWEMPLHYGSQLEEHRQVRSRAGMFDVSHMLAVDIRGSAARALLRKLLANDVAKLTRPGQALYTCMLNSEGGVLDDLIVYFLAEAWFRVVVNAGTAEKDVAWIDAQCAGAASRCELSARRDLAIIAVQGPQAREKVWRALPQSRDASEPLARFQAAAVGDMLLARTGYTGEDGFEIMLPAEHGVRLWNALTAQGVAPAGLGARDTLRLEAGMLLYGQDLDDTVTPLESGLAWTVNFNSARDFIGKAALLAKPAARQLLGLLLLDRGVMRSHQKIRCAGGAGVVTSGGFSPTLNQSIALARVPRGTGPGDVVDVEVRGKWLRAKVVKPRFVRDGKILVQA
jgi:aminomethyltransferase